MNSEPEFDDLLNALRSDLPSERDSARLRAKLSALGIAAGVTATSATAAASTASAAAGAAKGTALIGGASVQATGWSLAAKLGVAAAVSVSAVSVAVVSREFSSMATSAPRTISVPAAPSLQHARVTAPGETTLGVPLPTMEPTPAAAPSTQQAEREAVPPSSVPTMESAPRRAVAGGAARGVAAPSALASAPRATNGALGSSTKAEQVDAPPDSSVGSFESTENAPSKTETTLAEETQLIDAALAAVRGSDSALAERWLAEHRRRFPNGLLHRERLRAERKLQDLRSLQGH